MNVNVSTSKRSGGSGGSSSNSLSGCFSIACCTIKWTISGSNYGNATVEVYLNNQGVGAFEFNSALQNWPVPPAQVGNCSLQSCLIQGQTAVQGGQNGSLTVMNFSLLQNGVTYTLQNEFLEAWNADGSILINNSNC